MSVKEVFDLFNTTGSGIEGKDLGTVLRAAGKAPSEAEIQELAASAGNPISEETLEKIATSQPELVESEVLQAFEIFDQNGNGFMPLKELMDVLRNLGEGVPDPLLEQLKEVAEPDEEQQVNIRHLVDVLLKTGM
mmetsp:Transcript_3431/g.8490  ORF Transcript_3431/g.8490 Transcript_3431/m.8490 type:complete len:135 (-) Transcript_3431:101-505(-)